MTEVRLETVADLRRQGAEEFRARAVAELDTAISRFGDGIAKGALMVARHAIAALPLEPEEK